LFVTSAISTQSLEICFLGQAEINVNIKKKLANFHFLKVYETQNQLTFKQTVRTKMLETFIAEA
jgi:hypothetical protein